VEKPFAGGLELLLLLLLRLVAPYFPSQGSVEQGPPFSPIGLILSESLDLLG
jgi:hypothetical protein